MAEGPGIVLVPGIAALSSTTARQIGSGQVLVDPSSVVKELIDNALDARATSIFVDVTANTIDSIQVKDDGHGIPSQDRPLVCRRSCTSKIRDFHDVRQVGGKWLGFRGSALSSMAEMSSSLHVITRVEGEPVAVKLKYGRDGELASVEHDSHPVGTTVKVTEFFDSIPVRKQTASKNSAKLLAKIRRLMQAYALARPMIRFRLRVLKAKNSNGDFIYAPKADASVEDAALKAIGKDCALQCDWTVLEADGFEVHAFLPRPGAIGPRIAHQGAFVSVDARPLSSSRGTIKQIITAYRNRLHKSNSSLAGVKDPFFCLNIICPPDSYDPNIEPTKDDVMFDNSDVVIGVVNKLLKAYYPEAAQDVQDVETRIYAQQQYGAQPEQLSRRIESSAIVRDDEPTSPINASPTNLTQALPRWRSSMYGIDEDDLEFLQENHAPVIEGEGGLSLPAELSNPWTIARMNTTIKPKKSVSNGQLLSPAKSQGGGKTHSSSPSPTITPHRPRSAFPLTPQTSSRAKMTNTGLERSIQHVRSPSLETGKLGDGIQDRMTDVQRGYELSTSCLQAGMSNHCTKPDAHTVDLRSSDLSESDTGAQGVISSLRSAPPCSRRAQQAYANKPFAPPTRGSYDAGFGQPLPGTQPFQPARHQHAMTNQGSRLSANTSPTPHRPVLNAVERRVPNQLHSDNNSDIRDFFGRNRDFHAAGSSVTSTNSEAPAHQPRGRPLRRLHSTGQRNAPIDGFSRACSAEPQARSKQVRNHQLLDADGEMNADSWSIIQQSPALAQREDPLGASAVGSQVPMLFDQRSIGVGDASSMHNGDSYQLELRNPTRHFQTCHDAAPQSSTSVPSLPEHECLSDPQRPSQAAAPSNTHCSDQSAEEMEAYFRSQEQQHSTAPSHPNKALKRQEPRIASPHETPGRTRRPRSRTTDALERTKSSKFCLERTRTGFQIQGLSLLLPTSIHTIIQCSRKLDMRRNSPEWGDACSDAYNVLGEPVSEKEIIEWVVKLDGLLRRRYEQIGGADTRCEMHEGIQRALDARNETSDGMPRVERVSQDGVDGAVGAFGKHVSRDEGNMISVVVHRSAVEAERRVDDGEGFAFDMGQFVDLKAAEEKGRQIMETADEGNVEAVEGEYEGDIEDEMLMDL